MLNAEGLQTFHQTLQLMLFLFINFFIIGGVGLSP
jgi:hypothetical protein